jgi:hypothetical protein
MEPRKFICETTKTENSGTIFVSLNFSYVRNSWYVQSTLTIDEITKQSQLDEVRKFLNDFIEKNKFIATTEIINIDFSTYHCYIN